VVILWRVGTVTAICGKTDHSPNRFPLDGFAVTSPGQRTVLSLYRLWWGITSTLVRGAPRARAYARHRVSTWPAADRRVGLALVRSNAFGRTGRRRAVRGIGWLRRRNARVCLAEPRAGRRCSGRRGVDRPPSHSLGGRRPRLRHHATTGTAAVGGPDRPASARWLWPWGRATRTEIADRFYMSLATVKAHVSRLLAKLGVDNRVQIAFLVHEATSGPIARRTPSSGEATGQNG